MRIRLMALSVVACLLSCASGSPPSLTGTSAPAGVDALSPYFGSFNTTDGDILVIARLGWFFDMRDATYRTIYSTASPNHFTIGFQFLRPLPKFADLTFDKGTLAVTYSTGKRTASRVNYKQTDVRIPATGAELAKPSRGSLPPRPYPSFPSFR